MGLEWHYCCLFDKMKGSPVSNSCEHWTGLWHDPSDMRHYQIIKQHWTSVFVFECPGNGCVTILLQYVGCLCHEVPCWLPRLPPPPLVKIWDILTKVPPRSQYQCHRHEAGSAAKSAAKKNGARKKWFSFSHFMFSFPLNNLRPSRLTEGVAHDLADTWPRKQKMPNFDVNYIPF